MLLYVQNVGRIFLFIDAEYLGNDLWRVMFLKQALWHFLFLYLKVCLGSRTVKSPLILGPAMVRCVDLNYSTHNVYVKSPQTVGEFLHPLKSPQIYHYPSLEEES